MRSLKLIRLLLVGLALTGIAFNSASASPPKGLNDDAFDELSDAGVDNPKTRVTRDQERGRPA